MNVEELKKRMAALPYPDNHVFDPETLKPEGVLAERVKLLKANVPELFKGGKTLIDIGTNKGFFAFLFAGKFKRIIAADPDTASIELAREIQKYHGLDNIEFMETDFERFACPAADVVYVGNCQHYLYRDDLRAGRDPLTHLRRLGEMARKVLILDGPMEHTDFAMIGMAKDEDWTDAQKKPYSLKNFTAVLEPVFKFVREEYNGIGKGNSARYTAVFKSGGAVKKTKRKRKI